MDLDIEITDVKAEVDFDFHNELEFPPSKVEFHHFLTGDVTEDFKMAAAATAASSSSCGLFEVRIVNYLK